MKKYLSLWAIVLATLLFLTACNGNAPSSTNEPPVNAGASAPTVAPTPEPTPSYYFDEVVINKGKKFSERGGAFNTFSEEANYYGEINIGSRSYVEGTTGNLDGTYALFVVESGNISLSAEFKIDGYYLSASDTGEISGDAVKYPFNAHLNAGTMLKTSNGSKTTMYLKGLSRAVVLFNRSQTIFAEAEFKMLAAVITQAEAVEYAQNGTLPKCMQGLTVTGLDEIFGIPVAGSPVDDTVGLQSNFIEIVPPIYDLVGNFSDGRAWVKVGNKFGYIDTEGNEIVPPIYDYVESFSEGFAVVRNGGTYDNQYGFIDRNGNVIVDLKYRLVEPFSDGMAAVNYFPDGRWGYVDTTGSQIITAKYTRAEPFVDGIAVVEAIVNEQNKSLDHNTAPIIIDKAGNELVQVGKYKSILNFSEGLARVTPNADYRYGFIDATGVEVIAPTLEYENVSSFSDGVAIVRDSKHNYGGWGFIDKEGSYMAIPIKYDKIMDYENGLAAVYLNNLWGFINKNGDVIIPCNYEAVYTTFLGENILIRAKNGKYALIDKQENVVVSLDMYSIVNPFYDGYAVASKSNEGNGVIDLLGNEIVPFGKYTIMSENNVLRVSEGYVIIYRDGKYGFIQIVD